MANALFKNNFLILVLAFLFTAILLSAGFTAHQILQSKTSEQNVITDAVIEWKQSYKGLKSVSDKWKTVFTSAEQVPDVRVLINVLNLNSVHLLADTDHINVVKLVPQVQEDGINVGLSKICLGIDGETFLVKAKSYNELLSGLDLLAKRSDITIGKISIQGELVSPQAKITDFCIFLRNEK